jgi:glutathione S-transferase
MTFCKCTSMMDSACFVQAPLEFDVVHVDLCNKPRWYSSVNPRGLVPAVTFNGKTLLESLDICRYSSQPYSSSSGKPTITEQSDSTIASAMMKSQDLYEAVLAPCRLALQCSEPGRYDLQWQPSVSLHSEHIRKCVIYTPVSLSPAPGAVLCATGSLTD